MKLKDRDIQILKYIRESRTLNINQIKRKFWPTKHIRTARKKMAGLAERGFVEHVKKDILRISSHYYITRQGYDVLSAAGLNHDIETPFLVEPSDIIRSDFQHHLRIADLRIELEMDKRIKINKWIPETAIRADKEAYNLGVESGKKGKNKENKFKYRIPDALFEMEDDEVQIKILLEYEHLRYQRWKFRAYMEGWENSWNEHQKLIVAADAERAEMIRKWCLEDLKKIYEIDINRKKVKLEDLAEAYIFTDYHSIMKKGLINADLKTPIGVVKFTPISHK